MRWIGAILVFTCCGYFGFAMAMHHKKEEKILQQIIHAIGYMQCELQYHLTPLPQLLGQASKQICGTVSSILLALSLELERQVMPDVSCCMESILRKEGDISQCGKDALILLGRSLGRFDLEGQLQDLECVLAVCQKQLAELQSRRDVRLRSYQTLGLCAGAALAILLL